MKIANKNMINKITHYDKTFFCLYDSHLKTVESANLEKTGVSYFINETEVPLFELTECLFFLSSEGGLFLYEINKTDNKKNSTSSLYEIAPKDRDKVLNKLKLKTLQVKFDAYETTGSSITKSIVIPSSLNEKEIDDYLYTYQKGIDGGDYIPDDSKGDWQEEFSYTEIQKVYEIIIAGGFDTIKHTHLKEALEDESRYLDVFPMTIHEDASRITERGEEIDFYDFMVRGDNCEETVNEAYYFEVDDVPISMAVRIEEFLNKKYNIN